MTFFLLVNPSLVWIPQGSTVIIPGRLKQTPPYNFFFLALNPKQLLSCTRGARNPVLRLHFLTKFETCPRLKENKEKTKQNLMSRHAVAFSYYCDIKRMVTASWRRNLNYLLSPVQHFCCIRATPDMQLDFLTSLSFEMYIWIYMCIVGRKINPGDMKSSFKDAKVKPKNENTKVDPSKFRKVPN